MKNVLLSLMVLFLSGCFTSDNDSSETTQITPDNTTETTTEDAEETSGTPDGIVSGYNIYPQETNATYNKEAVIPPQCYTKHEGEFNPCMTCHQNYTYGTRPNYMFDAGLQSAYEFSDYGFTNRWDNLFEDRTERIAEISDETVLKYIAVDNYTPLIETLENDSEWTGPVPKIDNLHLGAEAFDDEGFAKDGSHWVAFNYKPLPSTFWPTNGSTDDVIIRLPEAYRETSCGTGGYSRDTYLANLALLEMSFQGLDSISVPALNEQNVCVDLNNDGQLTTAVTQIDSRTHYVGNAADAEVAHMLYPQGTEFIHSVRYVGVDDEGNVFIPARMKELRYMKKTKFRSEAWLKSAYGNEHQEKIDGNLPNYIYDVQGTPNEFGWDLLGFIEDEQGRLRAQSRDESLFCMGCHTTIGSTIDQTFAFSRKITGAAGWGYINTRGMEDAPAKLGTDPEILEYFRAVGGGDEFRQNREVLARWFNEDGSVKEDEVRAADVYTLISPSRERALALNKAYMTIVEDQDFHQGRDANLAPAVNVYRSVDETSPVLPGEKTRQYDMRLNWAAE